MSFPPEPCRLYNGGHCRRGDDYCKHLHICEDYITDDCQPGCPKGLNHQLYSPQVRRVLDEAGIDPHQCKNALLAELTGSWDEDSCSDQDSENEDSEYEDPDESDDSEESEEESEICIFYLRGCCKFGYGCKNRHELPNNWTHTKYKRQQYKTITVPDGSHEYEKVEQHFFDAMKGDDAEVQSIMRVQNPRLWGKFDAKRRDMENDKELQLYHGTRQTNVASICLNGFDPDRAGENSEYLHHGHGVYFTSSAKYAAKGEFQDPDEKVVFLADVLVGKYIKGNPNYYSAPEGYDTCVDRVKKPTKFLKFDEHSSYPSYVIHFS